MRISDSQMYELSYQSLDMARSHNERLTKEALEQRRVLMPSDDPVAAANAQQERSKIERVESGERAVNAGVAALQLADSALSSFGDLIVRMKELAVQHANETYDANNRDAAAREVENIFATMVDLSNSEIRGNYIFGGYQTDQPPYDATGAYGGDNGTRQLEVAPGVRLGAGVPGDEVFGTTGGGVDVFQTVRDFQTALQNNDFAGVQLAVETMDVIQEQVSNARSTVGTQLISFEVSRSVLEQTELEATERQEDLIGVDPAESYLALTRAQQTLATAVQIAAQLPLPGLAGR